MNIKIYNSNNDFYNLCIVLHEGEEKSTITRLERCGYGKTNHILRNCETIQNEKILDLETLPKIRLKLIEKFKVEIDKKKEKLVSTKASDYSDEYNKDVLSLKKRIQTVAKRLSECDLEFEDADFNNRLHELYQMKKQLGSFANEYTENARKKNGSVKYEIKQLEKERDRRLDLLDMSLFEKVLKGE